MNWYELTIIFGVGVFLFFFVVIMIAKWLVRKDRIHQCKECGSYLAKTDVEKHLIQKHNGDLK